MGSEKKLIELAALRDMLALGAVRDVAIVGAGAGFALRVRVGMNERLLGTQRGGVRIMTLECAARTLREAGVGTAALVDLSAWTPYRRAAA